MAPTKTRSAPSVNGSAAAAVGEKAHEAGDAVASAVRRARTPVITLGATAAGLAGGLALGTRVGKKRGGVAALLAPRRRVLGVPVGRRNGMVRVAEVLRDVARELGAATTQVTETADDVRGIREQLDQANRQSPIEVLLDGLTHRRGAHRAES